MECHFLFEFILFFIYFYEGERYFMMKYGRNRRMLAVFAFFMFSMLFSGCAINERESVDMGEVKKEEVSSQEVEQTGEVSDKDIKLEFLQEDTGVEETQEVGADIDEKKKQFGENCISEQTFEVELSEFQGKVYFVPFLPSSQDGEFSMQIIQDGKVLEEIQAYIPERLKEESFKSLDAVSFYDVNYDGNTDLVLIETYGNFMFTAVYYGVSLEDGQNGYFNIQEQLSENLSNQVEPLSIPKIRECLSNGKKNGEFSCYQEAFEAVAKLCELESEDRQKFNLIYFDEDEIPELATGVFGYSASLYLYRDGKVYTLMDCWPYGAMGNTGYEYVPRKNSLRNDNSDFAGAIHYTTYMSVGNRLTLDIVAEIETFLFDDVNQNGIPDEDELESLGNYSVSYIDGKKATDEECQAYQAGEYEFMDLTMEFEELLEKLQEKAQE